MHFQKSANPEKLETCMRPACNNHMNASKEMAVGGIEVQQAASMRCKFEIGVG